MGNFVNKNMIMIMQNRIMIDVFSMSRRGQKAVIEAHWKKKGYKSLNAYVNELIRRDMAGEESGGVNFNGNVITGSNCISIKNNSDNEGK